MFAATRIRGWILSLELMFLCRARFLRKVPVLRRLPFAVNAALRVLSPADATAVTFTVDFRSPFFGLAVPLEKAQIGELGPTGGLQPASFRFFDWQTWTHIDGIIEWFGERRVRVDGNDVEFITGFRYRVAELPEGAGNLGLRLAEGVESIARVACGEKVARVPFQPVFWLLQATGTQYNPVSIRSTKLMGLIVPLFDLGRGDPRVRDRAVAHLQQWAETNLGGAKPFRSVFAFLKYVRDWGPLAMDPMFPGVALVLERLGISEPERHLFDFFADNWGMRSNRNGRVLAVKLLESMSTERALAALESIRALVEHQSIAPEELDLIRAATAKLTEATRTSLPQN